MARAIWKGSISFGLVNVPVALRPAAHDNRLDLDWLDKRDMAPVGYQRINKRTGKVIEGEHIVKGYQYEKGEYVLLSDEDFRQANVEATQTIDIVSFVKADSIPPYFFETPYYLEPDKRGAKGYALLRETMRKTGHAALALVVLRNRQHLCAMLVRDNVLVLNTMRFASEVLPIDEVDVPASGAKGTKVTDREIDMARRLVEEMSEAWKPDKYHDTYQNDLMARIQDKIAAGKTHELAAPSDEAPAGRKSAKIIDLMALLEQSLSGRDGKKRGKARVDKARAAADEADETDEADERDDAAAGKARTSAAAKAGGSRKSAGKPAKTASKTASKTATRSASKAAATKSARKSGKPAEKTASGAKPAARKASGSDGTTASRSAAKSSAKSAAKSTAKSAAKSTAKSAGKPAGKPSAGTRRKTAARTATKAGSGSSRQAPTHRRAA